MPNLQFTCRFDFVFATMDTSVASSKSSGFVVDFSGCEKLSTCSEVVVVNYSDCKESSTSANSLSSEVVMVNFSDCKDQASPESSSLFVANVDEKGPPSSSIPFLVLLTTFSIYISVSWQPRQSQQHF